MIDFINHVFYLQTQDGMKETPVFEEHFVSLKGMVTRQIEDTEKLLVKKYK